MQDANTVFDPKLNTIEFTEENLALPDGHIIKTLRSGYIYNGEIIRKSKVVAVKNQNKE